MAEILINKKTQEIYSVKDLENIFKLSPFFISEKKNILKESKLLKKKKKVTIKKDVEIINIETYKEFNIDVSISGGCPEWDFHSNYEEDMYEFENEICNIF